MMTHSRSQLQLGALFCVLFLIGLAIVVNTSYDDDTPKLPSCDHEFPMYYNGKFAFLVWLQLPTVELVQLLKSLQDKRFVCEAARMTTGISPNLLLPKLQPHLKNKNPRIQAKASMCFCHSVLYLGVESMNSYGIDKLIQVAAPQLSDQIPESREAAWTLLLKLQTIYKKSHELTLPMSDNRELSSWEHLC